MTRIRVTTSRETEVPDFIGYIMSIQSTLEDSRYKREGNKYIFSNGTSVFIVEDMGE